MIFVTVGTQKFQMNRLLKKMDGYAKDHPDVKVVVQSGHSDYVPKYCETYQFMDRPKFEECINNCAVLVSHGGVGTIMEGIRRQKPVVVVPRLREFGEHVDDHQLEAAMALRHNRCILLCMNIDFLDYIVDNAMDYKYNIFQEPIHRVEDLVLECIEDDTDVQPRKGFFGSIKNILGMYEKEDSEIKQSQDNKAII